MSKPALIGITLVAVTVAFLMWWYSDARIVQRQSDSLVKSLNVTGSETKNFLILKTNSFSNLLAESVNCHVDVSRHRSNYSYDELVAAHNYFVRNVITSNIKTSDAAVTMIDDTRARYDAALSLNVTGKGSNRLSETGTISVHWQKNDSDKWRVSKIEIARNEP